MRINWTERGERPGWEVTYTTIGGRLRLDPLEQVSEDLRQPCGRAVSQVFVAATPNVTEPDLDVAYWAAVAKKIIQRGERPVLMHKDMEGLGSSHFDAEHVLAAVAGPPMRVTLDDSIALDATFERPFWEWVESETPLSRWCIPQAPLEAIAGQADTPASQWVDWLIYFPWSWIAAVVEVDGSGHARRAGVDKARDQFLKTSGCLVERIPGPEVASATSLVMQRLAAAAPPWLGTADLELIQAIHIPGAVQRLAFGIVEAVERGFLPPGGPWNIVFTSDVDGVEQLSNVALDLLATVADAWDLAVVPDEVTVNGTVWSIGNDERFARSARSGQGATDVEIRLEAFTPPHAALNPVSIPTIVIRGAYLPQDLSWGGPPSAERRNRPGTERSSAALDRVLRDVLGYESYREAQREAVDRVLTGGDTCVLLPTGAGKSLIYQIAGLLRPGVTIVVAPLKSLIDDQARRLEEIGIDRVLGIHSGSASTTDGKRLLQQAVGRGEALFTLVAPERLQIEDFRRALQNAAQHHLVNLAVVDEAHCVSEWGHQFRTSYLKLGRNLRRFCQDPEDVSPPILALTATASPRVLNDMLDELGLDREEPGVLHRPTSFDRPNLHYEVFRGVPATRDQRVADALARIAEELGVSVAALGEEDGDQTRSGIVFVPHASSGMKLGLTTFRDVVSNTLMITDDEVALFSGTKPKEIATPPTWEDQKVQYASDFRTNTRPVMISTNAFGMGIDKPNIRYTLHVSMPSSIEAYAQEAGRSGRDGAKAHCALVVSNEPGIDLSTIGVRQTANLNYPKSDVLIQLRNLASSFPDPVDEYVTARTVLSELLEAGKPGFDVAIPRIRVNMPHTLDGETEARDRERALYRLLLLGVIDDYTIEYGSNAFTVFLEPFTADSVVHEARLLVHRITAGKRQFIEQIDSTPIGDTEETIEKVLQILIHALYATVEPARANALREMYLLAELDEPEAVRAKINAYLSEGPVSAILNKAVMQEAGPLELLRQLEENPPSTEDEWAGTAARYLESYPDQPVLLIVRALGEAWRRGGSREEFQQTIGRLMDSLPDFVADTGDQAALLTWILSQLRTYFEGERWAWAPDIWGAIYASSLGEPVIELVEDAALANATSGEFESSELRLVLDGRMQRSARRSAMITDRLTKVS